MGRADAALALAGVAWFCALAPAPAPESRCQDAATGAAVCARLETVAPVQLLFGRALDLNRASASSLEVLPGIGPARAAAIVAERCRARFASVSAVERVSGIGPAIRLRMAPRVEIRSAQVAGCEQAGLKPPARVPAARRTPASSYR